MRQLVYRQTTCGLNLSLLSTMVFLLKFDHRKIENKHHRRQGGYKNLHQVVIKSQGNNDGTHCIYTSFVADRRFHIVDSSNNCLFCRTTLSLKVNHTRVRQISHLTSLLQEHAERFKEPETYTMQNPCLQDREQLFLIQDMHL